MRRAVSRQLSPLLYARAAAMRAAPTATEALLWEPLRGGRLGVGFRRRVPVGRFIADFCAPAARLVVEVDGACHAGRARADARRDRALSKLGFTVLRIPAELVASDLPAATHLVITALARAGA
jgi:very-short-patch-repair endonuclease